MSRLLRDAAQAANPNSISDVLRALKFGTLAGLVQLSLKAAVVTNEIVLPDLYKARQVLSAYATAGTSTGAKTPIAGAAPAAGEVGITVDGDIVFNGTDAVTSAEVVYLTFEGELKDVLVTSDATGLCTLPDSDSARLLILAEAAGVARTVLARAAAPAAAQAAITLLGTGVKFNVADANKACRVKYVAWPKLNDNSPGGVQDRLLQTVQF